MPSQHKSPFSEEIFREWDQLVLSKGEQLNPNERTNRARALLDRCASEGRWNVHEYDAGLVASVNVGIMLTERRFKEALELCRLFLSHPNLSDLVNIAHFTAREGIAGILSGDVEDGVELLSRRLLQDDLGPTFRHDVRNVLCAGLSELGEEKSCDPRVRDLVALLLNTLKVKKRLAKRAESASTNGQLIQLLHATFQSP